MRLENDIKLDYSDVLIRPKRSTLTSRKEVDLERKFTFRNYVPGFPENVEDYHYRGVPVMAANMDGVGTFKMADALATQGIFTCLVKTYSEKKLVEYFNGNSNRTAHVAMSIGTSNADYDKFVQVYARVNDNLKYLCIDVANGYSEAFVSHVRNIRKIYPNIVIIAGNVVTADQTQELILNGADIIKVGIGPGSVCTTRIQTGVGYPQLSAIIECADAAHGLGGHVIADGGCTCPGDVAKAFAAGADFVMLGGMLAGHDEGGGDVITKHYKTGEVILHQNDHSDQYELQELFNTKKFVQFYGMSSDAANTKHFGGLKDYRASEGREVLVPYRGDVSKTVQTILGGVRSTCTYVGASSLKQLSKCTTFIRVNNQYNRTYESSTTKM
jgi:GMP reductase